MCFSVDVGFAKSSGDMAIADIVSLEKGIQTPVLQKQKSQLRLVFLLFNRFVGSVLILIFEFGFA